MRALLQGATVRCCQWASRRRLNVCGFETRTSDVQFRHTPFSLTLMPLIAQLHFSGPWRESGKAHAASPTRLSSLHLLRWACQRGGTGTAAAASRPLQRAWSNEAGRWLWIHDNSHLHYKGLFPLLDLPALRDKTARLSFSAMWLILLNYCENRFVWDSLTVQTNLFLSSSILLFVLPIDDV